MSWVRCVRAENTKKMCRASAPQRTETVDCCWSISGFFQNLCFTEGVWKRPLTDLYTSSVPEPKRFDTTGNADSHRHTLCVVWLLGRRDRYLSLKSAEPSPLATNSHKAACLSLPWQQDVLGEKGGERGVERAPLLFHNKWRSSGGQKAAKWVQTHTACPTLDWSKWTTEAKRSLKPAGGEPRAKQRQQQAWIQFHTFTPPWHYTAEHGILQSVRNSTP